MARRDALLPLRIDLRSVPTHCLGRPVRAALQAGRVGEAPGRAVDDGLRFEIEIAVREGKDGRPDFRGPLVHGKPGERFLYVAWFYEDTEPQERFRRLKLYLGPLQRAAWSQPGIDWEMVRAGAPLWVSIEGRGEDGMPHCGTAPAHWRVSE